MDILSRINSERFYSFPSFQNLSVNYRKSLGVPIIYMRLKQRYFTVIEYEIDLSRHTISSVQKSMYIISIKFYSNLKGQMILNDNHLDLDPLT